MSGTHTDAAFLDRLYEDLFPICRSITGPGLEKSLRIIGEEMPLQIESKPSGTEVFDWTIPPEWRIRDAYLEGPDGTRYADFTQSNLSVLNYSTPVDRQLPLEELQPHLYSDPELPEAIPYVTSYYERNWGFCLPHEVREDLPSGKYHAYIDSELTQGELHYGHTRLEGTSDREVLLSSYLCHPSLANNELSGPLVMTLLYDRLRAWDDRYFTYRFVLCPETIGSLSYLSEYGDDLRYSLVGGLVLTCLGGPDNGLSYKTSRQETALVDRLAKHMSEHGNRIRDLRRFRPVGSDERQYCSPGFDLPVGQLARTVYEQYPEYHTSADDKSFMNISQLVDSVDVLETFLRLFEQAGRFQNTEPYGEPMLGKRDLYPGVNSKDTREANEEFIPDILSILNYSDGNHPMVEIANRRNRHLEQLLPALDQLREAGLVVRAQGGETPDIDST